MTTLERPTTLDLRLDMRGYANRMRSAADALLSNLNREQLAKALLRVRRRGRAPRLGLHPEVPPARSASARDDRSPAGAGAAAAGLGAEPARLCAGGLDHGVRERPARAERAAGWTRGRRVPPFGQVPVQLLRRAARRADLGLAHGRPPRGSSTSRSSRAATWRRRRCCSAPSRPSSACSNRSRTTRTAAFYCWRRSTRRSASRRSSTTSRRRTSSPAWSRSWATKSYRAITSSASTTTSFRTTIARC